MQHLKQALLTEIESFQPVAWETIPDLGLYMDQVITFITRAYDPMYGDSTKSYLSAPMINNYVKNKLIPRPKGKKYTRMHIALLIMIVVLKHVCTMEDIREMIVYETEEDVRGLYQIFCERQLVSIREMTQLSSNADPALDHAIFAAVYHAGAEAILHADPVPDSAEENKILYIDSN